MRRVLITDDVHPLLLEGLKQNGYTCDYFPTITNAEVLQQISDCEGLIINSKILVNKTLLDKAARLRFVGRLGSGLEIIDLAYAKECGVAVYSSPAGNCDAVAEHALGMLLMLANNLRQADAQVRQQIWQREANRGWELMGKTIGIVGCGHTGSALARRLAGWGMHVLIYDKYRSDYPSDLQHCHPTTMEQLWEECDIVSFHLPLTEETRWLVDMEYLSRFRKNIVLVNTSRGTVVRTPCLLTALQRGNVLGACLDVFENEKPETFTEEEREMYQALYAMPNVVFSPHIAGWTRESKERLAQIVLDKILGSV